MRDYMRKKRSSGTEQAGSSQHGGSALLATGPSRSLVSSIGAPVDPPSAGLGSNEIQFNLPYDLSAYDTISFGDTAREHSGTPRQSNLMEPVLFRSRSDRWATAAGAADEAARAMQALGHPNPQTLLGAGHVDPFDTYPMVMRLADHQLVYHCK